MRSPLLLLSVLLLSCSTAAVSVPSCCPASQTLDLSTDTPQCITSAEVEVDTVVRGSVGTLCLFEFHNQEILLRWGLRAGVTEEIFSVANSHSSNSSGWSLSFHFVHYLNFLKHSFSYRLFLWYLQYLFQTTKKHIYSPLKVF